MDEKEIKNPWNKAWSFEDYVIDLFERKQMQTDEFKTLIQIFGRERIKQIWEKYLEMKKRK